MSSNFQKFLTYFSHFLRLFCLSLFYYHSLNIQIQYHLFISYLLLHLLYSFYLTRENNFFQCYLDLKIYKLFEYSINCPYQHHFDLFLSISFYFSNRKFGKSFHTFCYPLIFFYSQIQTSSLCQKMISMKFLRKSSLFSNPFSVLYIFQ